MKKVYSAFAEMSLGRSAFQSLYENFATQTRLMVLLVCMAAGLGRSGELRGQTTIQIGTQTTSQPSVSTNPGSGANGCSPYGYGNKKWQGIYTKAMIENAMTTAGFASGSAFIHSVGFNIVGIVTASYNCTGYTVRMANVAQADLSGGYYTGAMSTVYGPTNNVFASGWFSLPIPSAFQWDGTSNLCVEVCFTGSAPGFITTYGSCQWTNVGGNNRMGWVVGTCATAISGTQTNNLSNMRLSVTSATPCTGAPAATTAASATVCANTSTTIGLTGLVGASGYTYQWKQSASSGGTYVNASGTATNSTYATPTTLPYNPTYYICEVTCSNSGQMTASSPGTVSVNNFLNCYCTPSFTATTSARGITNVNLVGNSTTINQTSSVNTTAPGFTLYSTPVAELTSTLPYALRVTSSTQTSNNYFTAFIDYDQSGTYGGYNSVGTLTAGGDYNIGGTLERIGSVGPVANGQQTLNFTVPANAVTGTTGMRVMYRYNGAIATLNPCTPGVAGEGEDYRVLIMAGCDAPEINASASSTSSILSTSATIQWTNGDGDAGRVVVLRQGSAVNTGPLGGTAYTANSTFGLGPLLGTSNYIVYNGNGSSTSVTGLLPSTTYYYEIYEYHSTGTCYQLDGHTGNFTTASCAPVTNASNLTYSAITNVGMTANWVRGSGTHVLVVARLTATARVFPVYNTTYTTNTVFGTGVGSAITGAGNFVVYNGTGTSVSVTGMANLTNYTFDVYEYNASPNCYWFTIPLTGANSTLDGTLSGGCSATVVRTTGSGQYTAITPATVLNNTGITTGYYQGGALNTPGAGIPIGFDFVYNGVTYNSFGLGVNGYIWFGSGVPSPTAINPISNASPNLGGSGTIDGIVSAAGVQITTSAVYNTGRSIGYTLSGVAPNRVLKIQWKGYSLGNNAGGNCDFYYEILGGDQYLDGGRCDFQIILNENGGINSNKIGIAYADMNAYCADGNTSSAQVGLRGATNADFTNRTGAGNSNWAASAGTVNTATCTMGASNYISGNTLLTFTQAILVPPTVNGFSSGGTASNACPATDAGLAAGAGFGTYQWFKDGVIVPGPGSSSNALTANESGNYTVVGKSGSCYLQSNSIVVTIATCAPVINNQPSSSSIACTAGVIQISVEATDATGYQWQISTNGGSTWANLSNNTRYSGVSTATLNITNPPISFTGYRYQVIVSNDNGSVTSAASILTVQACPSNDNPASNNPALNNTSYVYPNVSNIQGTTTNATINPATGDRDVWYQFTAISNGVSVRVGSTQIDAKIYLFDNNSYVTPLDAENAVAGTGSEILNYGNLVQGNVYRIAVASANENDGTFNICIQKLRIPQCGAFSNLSLCSSLSSSTTGAANTLYSFTDADENTSTISSSGNGLVPLGHSALQLRYGASYDIGLTANYALQDGAGNPDPIQVSNSLACSITTVAQPLLEVRSNLRCVNGATLFRSSYVIGTSIGTSNICGVTGYRVEFTQVSNCAGDNPQNLETFTKDIISSTASISLSYAFNHIPLTGNTAMGRWSVRWAPMFGSVVGVYGPAHVISVNGTSAPAMVTNNHDASTLANLNNTISATMYPNPNNGELVNLNMTGITSDNVFVRIMDAMGREVYTNRFTVEGSLNMVVNFSKPLAQGLYMVEFRSGNDVITQRMMVSK